MRFALGCVVLAACSTPTANVAGTYTAQLTQGSDGCNVSTVSEGTVTTGVTMVVTQTTGTLTADVGGAIASDLMTLIGNHVYTGSIDGDGLQLGINGGFTRQIGNCSYHLDTVITAEASGSTLTGELDYRAVSADPTCVMVTDAGSDLTGGIGCNTTSTLSASRP